MKKFVNDVESLLAESLQGMAAAHSDLLALHLDPIYVTRKEPAKSKVALISGGGAGHEPLHCGLIGKGMLDAACPGQVFTSPTPDQMLAAASAVVPAPSSIRISASVSLRPSWRLMNAFVACRD